jgi:pyruvate dehydrogenase E2 component (dihydrolipoamide acetyltransferase)
MSGAAPLMSLRLRAVGRRPTPFALSNLGMWDAEGGMPTVTAPQAAVIFVGAIRETVTAFDGPIAIRPVFTLVNGFDHRAVEGATAARFSAALRGHLQVGR